MSWKCPTCALVNSDLNRACPSCNTPTVKNFLEECRQVDQSIQLRSDLFNAHTPPIIERIKFILADDSVPNESKQFKIAETLLEMFRHQRDVCFTKRTESIDAENKLRAIQSTLNDYANRLHQTERDILKIENINYDPTVARPITKPASVNKVSKAKYNRTELSEASTKYNLPALAIQMTCIARNVSPDEAGRLITAAKHQSS